LERGVIPARRTRRGRGGWPTFAPPPIHSIWVFRQGKKRKTSGRKGDRRAQYIGKQILRESMMGGENAAEKKGQGFLSFSEGTIKVRKGRLFESCL